MAPRRSSINWPKGSTPTSSWRKTAARASPVFRDRAFRVASEPQALEPVVALGLRASDSRREEEPAEAPESVLLQPGLARQELLKHASKPCSRPWEAH